MTLCNLLVDCATLALYDSSISASCGLSVQRGILLTGGDAQGIFSLHHLALAFAPGEAFS
jgi:hypothetical protein